MANNVVDRSTDGGGEGGVARRGVTHGGRLDLKLVGDEIHAKSVELARCDACLHMGRQEVESGRSGLAGSAHFIQIDWVGNETAHGRLEFSGEIRSEEHTSELQSLMRISYAVF